MYHINHLPTPTLSTNASTLPTARLAKDTDIYTIEHFVRRSQWIPDEERQYCSNCHIQFTKLKRKHHCRRCGEVVCGHCCSLCPARLPGVGQVDVRICRLCVLYDNENCVETMNGTFTGRSPTEINLNDLCSYDGIRQTSYRTTMSSTKLSNGRSSNNRDKYQIEIELNDKMYGMDIHEKTPLSNCKSSNACPEGDNGRLIPKEIEGYHYKPNRTPSTSTCSSMKSTISCHNRCCNTVPSPNKDTGSNEKSSSFETFLVDLLKKTTATQQQLATQQTAMSTTIGDHSKQIALLAEAVKRMENKLSRRHSIFELAKVPEENNDQIKQEGGPNSVPKPSKNGF